MGDKTPEKNPLPVEPERKEVQSGTPSDGQQKPPVQPRQLDADTKKKWEENEHANAEHALEISAKPKQDPSEASPVQPSSAPQPSPKEEDAGQEKDAVGKLGDTVQKLFGYVEALYRKIQEYGSSQLLSWAGTLRLLGMEKAAKFLENMAQSDYAALQTASGGKIKAPVLEKEKKEDPVAVAEYVKQTQEFNAKLEELGAIYQSSQGYTKVGFYREAIKMCGTDYTIDTVVEAAKKVPQVNPLGPKQAPTPTPAVPEAGMDVTASMLTINGVPVSRVEQNNEKLLNVNGKKFRVKAAGVSLAVTKIEQMPDLSLRISGAMGFMTNVLRVPQAEINRIVSLLSQTTPPTELDVSYLDAAAVAKTQRLTFEVV